jgi:hypothetical protein
VCTPAPSSYAHRPDVNPHATACTRRFPLPLQRPTYNDTVHRLCWGVHGEHSTGFGQDSLSSPSATHCFSAQRRIFNAQKSLSMAISWCKGPTETIKLYENWDETPGGKPLPDTPESLWRTAVCDLTKRGNGRA